METSKLTGEQTTETSQTSIDELRQTMEQFQLDALQRMPMWIRARVVRNSIYSIREKEHDDSNINFEKLNKILTLPSNETDYNQYPENGIHTVDEFEEWYNCFIQAQVFERGVPWHTCECVGCHKKFTLTLSEINFYKNKELNIPKRCPECRKMRKERAEAEKEMSAKNINGKTVASEIDPQSNPVFAHTIHMPLKGHKCLSAPHSGLYTIDDEYLTDNNLEIVSVSTVSESGYQHDEHGIFIKPLKSFKFISPDILALSGFNGDEDLVVTLLVRKKISSNPKDFNKKRNSGGRKK